MKKLIAGIAFLGTVALVSAQTITFDKTTADYGVVSPKSDGMNSFTVKNTGDKPLIISKVQPSCGCTTPEWSQEPIMPGKSGKIKVHFDVATHPGVFNKLIEVYSNDPKNSRSVIYIKGNVDANAPIAAPKPLTVEEKKAAEKAAKKAAKDAKKLKAA